MVTERALPGTVMYRYKSSRLLTEEDQTVDDRQLCGGRLRRLRNEIKRQVAVQLERELLPDGVVGSSRLLDDIEVLEHRRIVEADVEDALIDGIPWQGRKRQSHRESTRTVARSLGVVADTTARFSPRRADANTKGTSAFSIGV